MSRILLAITAADSLRLKDGTDHATGFWAEELVVAHRELTAAGHEVVLATPGGRRAPVDPGSLAVEGGAEFERYLEGISEELEHPAVLGGIEGFDAIVLPGGHGPMADLATDPVLGRILVDAVDHGVVVAPFCHGPAALLSATRDDGSFAFAGRRVAVFTDAEELAGGLGDNAPWFVASTLAERGAVLDTGAPWSSHVVVDGALISGQNPQSSAAVAAAVLEAMGD